MELVSGLFRTSNLSVNSLGTKSRPTKALIYNYRMGTCVEYTQTHTHASTCYQQQYLSYSSCVYTQSNIIAVTDGCSTNIVLTHMYFVALTEPEFLLHKQLANCYLLISYSRDSLPNVS